MKIGVSRFSQTPEQAFKVLELAQRFGFAGVQLKPAQYQEFVVAPAEFRKRYGDLADLACGGLIFYPSGNPEEWPDKLESVLTFASAIDAQHVCLCSGVFHTNASDAQVQAVADALMTIGEKARAQNLRISIHNHVGSVVESEEDIARLLQLVEPQLCGLTLDTAHAAKAGIANVPQLATRFQAHLLNVHLKDLDSDGRFCALGQGTLEIQPILDALKSVQYDQWLIVDEETTDLSTEQAFQIASDYLQQNGIKVL